MRLLFIAPQPFYQERGTPIAVKLLLEALVKHFTAQGINFEIDLLTYHEGQSLDIPGVKHTRIKAPFGVSGITPGISFKKLVCDVALTFKCFSMLRTKRYDLAHAVEEAGFIALAVKLLTGTPYIYDIDSNLIEQLCQKWRWCKPFALLGELFEKQVIKHSSACLAMCSELVDRSLTNGALQAFLLTDVALPASAPAPSISLRHEFRISADTLIALYVGNLEHYQGIDLMIDAYAASGLSADKLALIVIGGPQYLDRYTARVASDPMLKGVYFAGPRPVGALPFYLDQADILLSPRTRGNNTPMKIYSYLAAGKAILATRLPTHTQVLNDTVSLLCDPTAHAMSTALKNLVEDSVCRETLAQGALEAAELHYTVARFEKRVAEIYASVMASMQTNSTSTGLPQASIVVAQQSE